MVKSDWENISDNVHPPPVVPPAVETTPEVAEVVEINVVVGIVDVGLEVVEVVDIDVVDVDVDEDTDLDVDV